MRNVTLRQMRVFAAVARHLSFTRAARELHVQWSEAAPMFPESYDALYASLRSDKPKVTEVAKGATGDVEKAKENLALLRKLCPAGCEELSDLQQAIDTKVTK